ncbi:MAG: N-acetylneuraminate synthase [Butyrivibrio sp.]|nr:N-acetylneuraminate synthase [Butyrivibrio sp.]
MGVYIIAEAGVNHNGSLETAKRLVDMAKECGADAVKFQTFKAEESTGVRADKAEYQKENDGARESQFDMIKRLELPFGDFALLKKYCAEKQIDFISTPDGSASLACLLDINVSRIKIGSTEVTNAPFLKEIARSGKPVILSTGMSTLGEVEKAVDILLDNGVEELELMHCTTDYPTALEDVNLRAMLTLRNAFNLPSGYSDHTAGFEAAIAATAMGASVIEKHITLDREMQGPDHRASMPPEEFAEYVRLIRNTECLLGDGKKKPTPKERVMMRQVRRSILASRDLAAGTVLTEEMLCVKRPGTGIAPDFIDIVTGRSLKRNIAKEEPITWEDV